MSYSARASELDELSREVKRSAREYFASSDMENLFPQLFEALWHYTLPCFPDAHAGRALLQRCSIGDEEIPCRNIFSRVPTDSGPGHNLYFDVTLFRHVLCHQHRRSVQKHNICCFVFFAETRYCVLVCGRALTRRPRLVVSEGVKCGPGIGEYVFCVFSFFFARRRKSLLLAGRTRSR